MEKYKLHFYGSFQGFFKLYLVKVFLTILTLGLYYPWARVAILKYKYANSEFDGTRFSFTGDPKEIFKGYIVIWALGICYFCSKYVITGNQIIAIVGGIAGLLLVLLYPWMLVSSYRYRLSRTIWRGLSFVYTGLISTMYKILVKWVLIFLVTIGVIIGAFFVISKAQNPSSLDAFSTLSSVIGILSFILIILIYPILYAVFQVSIYKELVSNIRYGNVTFEYKGEALELFKYRFFGFLGSFLTFGLSIFWMYKKEQEFKLDNTLVLQNGERIGKLELYYNYWHFVSFHIANFFIILFSLGFATPWVVVRNVKFYFKYLSINANIDFESIEQYQQDGYAAYGDTFVDALAFDFGVF